MLERLMVPLLVVLGGVFVIWYVGGNELMRRRGGRLAVWCKRVADNASAKQTIKWYTLHSFLIEAEHPKLPFRSMSLTGLTESWDIPVIWLWNRLNWRRDMVLAQLTFGKQPMWGCEIYRPRSVLAGDASHAARQEGWPEAPVDGLRLAPAEGPGHELATQLLQALTDHRHKLIRLSVRRNQTHLSLAMNVPDPDAFPPAEFHQLLTKLAKAAASDADHPTGEQRASAS